MRGGRGTKRESKGQYRVESLHIHMSIYYIYTSTYMFVYIGMSIHMTKSTYISPVLCIDLGMTEYMYIDLGIQ